MGRKQNRRQTPPEGSSFKIEKRLGIPDQRGCSFETTREFDLSCLGFPGERTIFNLGDFFLNQRSLFVAGNKVQFNPQEMMVQISGGTAGSHELSVREFLVKIGVPLIDDVIEGKRGSGGALTMLSELRVALKEKELQKEEQKRAEANLTELFQEQEHRTRPGGLGKLFGR